MDFGLEPEIIRPVAAGNCFRAAEPRLTAEKTGGTDLKTLPFVTTRQPSVSLQRKGLPEHVARDGKLRTSAMLEV